jgi:signal transduction histidine kinase
VRAAVDGLVHELGAACAGVFLSDEASATGRPAYTVNYPPDVLQMLAAVPRGAPAMANVALQSGEVQVVTDIEDLGTEATLTRALGERMGVRSAAFVQLLAGGRRLGALVFGLAVPHAFQEAEVGVLARLGDRLADALDRARLQRALAKRAEHAELLASIATAAAGEENLGRILESALDRLGRVAVRDQFLSIASHELKTPLTPIKAASQLLLRFSRAETLDRDRLNRQLVTIQNQVDRLCRLVDDLLDVTRIQAGQLS